MAGNEESGARSQTAEELSGIVSSGSRRCSRETVIEPRVRLNPGPDEADPNWLTDDDLLFIIRYAGGESLRLMALTLSVAFLEADQISSVGAGGSDVQLPLRPSQMLEIAGTMALQVDFACAVRLWQSGTRAERRTGAAIRIVGDRRQ